MNLPDGLLEQAKAKAAAEGATVTRLVIDGLRARVAEPTAERGPVKLPTHKLGAAAANLSDSRAVRDILDTDEDDV